jgi:hypothetical protein
MNRFAIAYVLCVIGLIVGSFALVIQRDKRLCAGYEEATSRKTKMVSGTCYIQHKEQWYSPAEFKHLIGEQKSSNLIPGTPGF